MNKVVYFHCGLGKTGSTAIQQYLMIMAASAKGNFLYPETGIVNFGPHGAHHDLGQPGAHYRMGIAGSRECGVSDIGMLYERLWSEIISSGMEKAIISTEMLLGPPEVLASLRAFVESARSDGAEVKCVVYLRNFVKWIKALHVQLCRMRDEMGNDVAESWPPEQGADFEKWISIMPILPSDQISLMANIFSRKDLIIRYYEGDVVEDFCKVVGIEFDGRKIVANKTPEKYSVLRDSLLTDNARKIIRERFQESESKFADEFLTKEQKSKYLEGLLDG